MPLVTHKQKQKHKQGPRHGTGFARTINWEADHLTELKNHPRLEVPALLSYLMKPIPAPVSTTAALLGPLNLSQLSPGAHTLLRSHI